MLALSGGVDSSVVAALLIKAIGKQLICVHVKRHRTHGKADEGRRGETLLGTRHQHPAINMFLKQAVREQGIPFEATARPTGERGSESMEK